MYLFLELGFSVSTFKMSIQPPKTLTEMIEFKMFESKLKQRDLAKLLGVTENSISEILNSKRKINLDFAKRLYEKLNIDPLFVLKNA